MPTPSIFIIFYYFFVSGFGEALRIMQKRFCFKILLSAATKNENKNYWFIYDLNWKCANFFSFDATELKIAPKSFKVFVVTEKIILKHFFWFLNFVKNLGSKWKVAMAPKRRQSKILKKTL